MVAAAVGVVSPQLGSAVREVGPGSVAIGFAPDLHGRTTLVLPPVGRASADTHRGPVHLTLELRSLDVPKLLSNGGRVDRDALEASIQDDIRSAMIVAWLRFVGVSVLVGGAASALLPVRHLRSIAAGGLVGGLLAGLLAASALPGFDIAEFDELTYEGPVNAGTQLLQTMTSDTGVVGERVDALANKLVGLYSASVNDSLADSPDEVVFLHISDLHLNPIGARLARQLAESFDVDAVIDTGDTTSFGTRFEQNYAELLANFDVPYLFVAGNHDSPVNRAAIKATPGITAIGGRSVTIRGVTIAGYDDPVITTLDKVPAAERERIQREAAPKLAELIETSTPDMVAVHNPVILQSIVGTVPVAIAGHQHQFRLGARDGTLVEVAGSTGATGLGSLLVESDLPASATLLRFRDGELVAIDELEIVGTSGDLQVRRHTVTAEDYDGDTADFIGNDVEEGTSPEPTDESTEESTTTTTR